MNGAHTEWLDRCTGAAMMFYFISVMSFSYREDTLVVSQLASLLFVGFCLLYLFETRRASLPYYLIAFFGYTMLAVFTLPFNPDVTWAIERIGTLFQLAIMSFFIINYLDSNEKVERALFYLVLSALVMFGMVFVFEGAGEIMRIAQSDGAIAANAEANRIGGGVNQQNVFGIFASLACIICIWQVYVNKKWLYGIAAAASLIFALLSGSRKSLLIMAAGILVIFFLSDQKGRLKRIAGVALLFMTIGLIVSYVPMFQGIAERYSGLISFVSSGQGDESTRLRNQMIVGGWKAFLEHPFIGYGVVGSGPIATAATGKTYLYLHNNYIELLVNSGIIGFALYYSFYLSMLKGLLGKIRKEHSLRLILLALLAAIFIMEIGAVTYCMKEYHIIFAIISAYLLNSRQKKESRCFPQNAKILAAYGGNR